MDDGYSYTARYTRTGRKKYQRYDAGYNPNHSIERVKKTIKGIIENRHVMAQYPKYRFTGQTLYVVYMSSLKDEALANALTSLETAHCGFYEVLSGAVSHGEDVWFNTKYPLLVSFNERNLKEFLKYKQLEK